MTSLPRRPTATEAFARALAGALLFAASMLNADDAPVAPPVGPAIDVAARWRELFEKTDGADLNASFAVLGKIDTGNGQVDSAACAQNAQAITDALAVNTVGLALWYSAYQCALALQQPELAEQRLAVFAALSRYAVASRHLGGVVDTPIHVLSELDVWAFAHASGQQVLYAYYDAPGIGRELPITLALWDANNKRERILRFDYLDARARLWKDREFAELPAFRFGVAKGFISTFAKNQGSVAAAAQELQNATAGNDPAKRIAALENQGRDGNFAAVIGHAYLCLLPPNTKCAEASVDLLLPWAEKSYAMALVMLAVAYDQGRGVRRNDDNAQKLLKKADERLGEGRGSILFASFAAFADPQHKRVHPLVRKTLEDLAARGVPNAEWMLATFDLEQDHNDLSSTRLAQLRHAATAELSDAQQNLGLYLVKHAQREEGLRWIQKAAAAGERGAQIYLAKAYEDGDGVDKDAARARVWYAEAGLSGDVSAMLWMARYYADQPPSKKTRTMQEGWLESAMYKDNVQASLALARLYEQEEGADGSGKVKWAADIYRRLDRAHDSADARRRLAGLLVFSDKIDHDLETAQRLLQGDADRGDVKSQIVLGDMQARRVWGDDQKQSGIDLLKKLGNDGSAEALDALGTILFYGRAPQRREALLLWQRAVDKDYPVATNNLAWALCTSADPELLDGKRGLELARKIGASDDAPFGFRDTLAACYARNGDYANAELVEKAALARVEAQPTPSERALERAKARIALYHEHKAYVETLVAD